LWCFFLLSCTNEYIEFHQIDSNSWSLGFHEEKLATFDLKSIRQLEDIEVTSTPSLKLLEGMVDSIDSAKTRVRVEVYILTEKRIQKALKRAHERGVEVKIILEKNVYQAPILNESSAKYLKAAWISVVRSNAQNYALNHTKMMIIDELAYVSTGNYSYSSFSEHREFFFTIHNQELIKVLSGIFLADYDGKKYTVDTPNLVLSPYSSRQKLESLLQSARSSVRLYCLNMDDEGIANLLKQKAKSWVTVQAIFPSLSKVQSNRAMIQDLESSWVQITELSHPSLHAKAILVDETYLYIWSVNFSTPSIDQNREIGFIVINTQIINKFLSVFWEDLP